MITPQTILIAAIIWGFVLFLIVAALMRRAHLKQVVREPYYLDDEIRLALHDYDAEAMAHVEGQR